jgi:hypothetical protein
MTSFSKQKSMLKLHLFSPEKSPDEAIKHTYRIVSKAFTDSFNKGEFNKNTVRFEKIEYVNTLTTELAQSNMGLTDEDKIKSLSSLFKKHLLM